MAIKVLRHDAPGIGSGGDGRYRERFLQEAQLGKRLNQPNVVRVDDFSEDAGVLYLEMEYAPGGSLADRLAHGREAGQLMPVDEAVRIALDVAQGLAALHAVDAVHRDLKPSNILFDGRGRAKVADWGWRRRRAVRASGIYWAAWPGRTPARPITRAPSKPPTPLL